MFQRKPYYPLNRISIDSAALIHNYHYFQNRHPEALIAPVLKSNAYGHGLTVIGKWIDKSIKVPFICVDSLYEAYELQKAGVKTTILIVGYTDPRNFATRKNLSQCSFPVFDEETLASLNQHQPGAKVHLKIDTGMNRLGIQPDRVGEWIEILSRYPKVKITGIYSHLSQADDPKAKKFTDTQIQIFKQVIREFEASGIRFAWKHIAATSGALTITDPEFNLIRLGIGFYGYTHPDLKPALTLTTHIAQVKTVEKGSAISYNGTHITKRPTTIAILPIGYYDGVDRRLSNKGQVLINGTACPILGRVCMNITIVDVAEVKNPQPGHEAIIFNTDNSLEAAAKTAGTIPYDLLVKLTETMRREML